MAACCNYTCRTKRPKMWCEKVRRFPRKFAGFRCGSQTQTQIQINPWCVSLYEVYFWGLATPISVDQIVTWKCNNASHVSAMPMYHYCISLCRFFCLHWWPEIRNKRHAVTDELPMPLQGLCVRMCVCVRSFWWNIPICSNVMWNCQQQWLLCC